MNSASKDLKAEVATYPQRQRQLTAVRFYLQHMLWECQQQWARVHGGVTNYKTVFDSIEHWRVQRKETVEIVTFNYDTMLEEGLSWLDLKFKNIEDYISDAHYRVYKLHGSVDWVRRVTTPLARSTPVFLDNVIWGAAHDVIRNAEQLQLSDTTKIETPKGLMGELVHPALAIPVQTKSDFECPPNHIAQLKKALQNVKEILIVGWRAKEQHFLKMLFDNTRWGAGLRCLVVAESKTAAQATASELDGAGLKVQFDLAVDGFTRFAINQCAYSFLMR